jgi:hypothetical protein
MASKKTLKVSELTYERVHGLKQGNESVDDVLQRELGLTDDRFDIENDLGAYLPAPVREWGSAVAKQIDDVAEFNHQIGRGEGNVNADILRFVLPEENISVAKMEFSENGFIAHYRDNAGEWTKCFGTIFENDTEEKELDRVLDDTTQKVEGAIRKWSDLSSK